MITEKPPKERSEIMGGWAAVKPVAWVSRNRKH